MNAKTLNNLTYTYLSIPTIIFLIGWCRYIISIPLTILIISSLILRYKNNKTNILEEIKTNKKQLIFILIISIIMVTLSGIGGFAFQNEDHLYRNAIFEELINNKWPIFHSPAGNYNYNTIFTYYIASWLPAALIAKITNISIGYIVLYLWNILGLFIVFNYIIKYFKGKYQYAILLFIFFSGIDIVGELWIGHNPIKLILNSTHIEWTTTFQMSSFTTQLFWVYNQALPAWLVTLFILNEKDNKYIGTITAMSLLFSTFPTIGLSLILIYKIFFSQKLKLQNWIKSTITWQNILIGIPILLINILFLSSNESGQLFFFGIKLDRLAFLLTLYFLEFGLYYIICYKYIENKKLFWFTLITLLICPLIRISHSEDFGMRSCIPSQIILFIFILETLPKIKNIKTIKYTLIILLSLGSITPLNEITRTIKNTKEIPKNEKLNLMEDDKSNNFYGKKDNNIFVEYIAKNK